MAEDTPAAFSPEEEKRFDKGVRQIRYEKHLAESNDWMSELSLEKISSHDKKDKPVAEPQKPGSGKVVKLGKSKQRRHLLAAAASVLLLVTAFFLLRPDSVDNNVYILAAQEAFSTPELLASKGGNACLDRAVEQYVQGSFDQTRIILGKCGRDNPNTRFLLGLLALQKGEYAAAVPHLTFARNQSNGLSGLTLGPPIDAREVSRADADWYLALAYLGGGRMTEARQLLTQISEQENHPFQKMAESLRQKSTQTH